jgi:UDP-N-acetylglucosamine--N-acetylmuramyl-(pentapeptide) pyrophosphoryl-undecaprenol N-acetylglucosamine transferase
MTSTHPQALSDGPQPGETDVRTSAHSSGPVYLAASLGGHLELLDAIRGAMDGHPCHWVTSEGARADALRGRGERVSTLPRMDQKNLSLHNLRAGVALARRERPGVIVTSGAGVVLSFCLAARAMGARIIFAETMARVVNGSLTGRTLSRVASSVYIQWPELRATYPAATLCRPALLEGLTTVGRTSGQGTFVTLGSHDQPFDRLLARVDEAARAGILPGPVFAQVGASRLEWPALEAVRYLSPEAFATRVAQAAVVVVHGGAGAIATVLRGGARPLVLARRADHNEHVDDHQEQLVRKLDELGLVVQIGEHITHDDIARTRVHADAAATFAGLPSLQDELRRRVSEVAVR